MKPISIKFPMVKERTGYRHGPRFILRPDRSGLHGAAFCAANMISKALSHRDWPPYVGTRDEVARAKIERLNMRVASLWARIFAGQIDQHDTRLEEAQSALTAAVHAYCGHAVFGQPLRVENGTASLVAA